MKSFLSLRLPAVSWCLLLASAAASVAQALPALDVREPVTAVGPARAPAQSAKSAEVVMMNAPVDVPAWRIDLAPLSAPALKSLGSAAQAGAGGDKGRPLAIGLGRSLPTEQSRLALGQLQWRAGADGARHARIIITSPGASALRVAMRLSSLPEGLTMSYRGAMEHASAAGASIAHADAADGVTWSPTVPGEVMVIELRAATTTLFDAVRLELPRLSHLVADGADLNPFASRASKNIGDSGACNIDVACVTPATTAFTDMTKAVVKITFTDDDGFSYACSAALLNDSIGSLTPYLFTANHCVGSAAAARTVNVYWFFDAISCGSSTPKSFVKQVGGAQLLGRSQDRDWALLRLLDTVPGGAYFAGWRAEPLSANAAVTTIHHPSGDLKMWSRGTHGSDEFVDYDGAMGVFSSVTWQAGTTEGGSSGAPLLTFLGSGGYYEVRGGLFGGYASCNNPGGVDVYSQLQAGLPLLRQYLTPNIANPGGQVAVTEFYNAALDHYFLSTNPAEIASLDAGTTVGWVRTGLRFLAYNAPSAGAEPVCRFYRAPAFGDSHFLSASAMECADTAAAHPVDWIYESPNVFYIALPNVTTGACPMGTSAVYRFFNADKVNHRYTAELTLRNELAAKPGWIAEGYGPGPYFPVMCAVAP